MEKELKKETEAGTLTEAKNTANLAAVPATAEIAEADGLLHIVTGGALSMTLNGEAITIDSAGEHKISCPKESTLAIGEGSLIGICRFDGTITKSFKNRPDLVFINNTTIIANDQEFFGQCYALENLDGTVVKCAHANMYGTLRNTRVRMAPYIVDASRMTSTYTFFQYNENLVSAPLIDTSNVESTTAMFYGCSNLSSVPLYDLSKVTQMSYMFFGCSTLKSLPAFDFSNVINAEGAFMKMRELREFPANLNFGKLVNGLLAFAGDYGLYIGQEDTYRIGNLLQFPAYSFPVCTTLMYAWRDQTVMQRIGKLNIPECTKMTGAFEGCFNLQYADGFTGLKFDINMSQCTKLKWQSLVNIMTEAADVTAIGPRTMTFGAANLAKLSAAHKAIATDKGWTLL